ncbi:hypothetical protein Z517_04622 [Fonsecaea pedrosoi CBS 271.37]|uniref:Major facilitator superfamily (MFS) profile domain-containing protein n=1 Tax=Fonsecaea pedrosoi CBS 271.37 TaxID=1442368 RepID=A0A0D2DUW2_9EURO|nr:uncharacterized protein Z517_04622 [Fonsecaea pedrosoi CBS 271.37]KIW81596.1 hypothetical protein Z517_04622 [Fonsecaea pedrosoi CBS 271.37]
MPEVAMMDEAPPSEKHDGSVMQSQIEQVSESEQNLAYDLDNLNPELHWRTWVAFGSICLFQMVSIVAFQGPPAVLSYLGEALHDPASQTWIPNSLSLVQAVLGPVFSSASDIFQARKLLLCVGCAAAVVGSGVSARSHSMASLIAGQTVIGIGFATLPLAYVVPSEILPRKWRPFAQGLLNVFAYSGAVLGQLTMGALIKRDTLNGWRNYFWFQMALWIVTLSGLIVGYRPPKRHTAVESLSLAKKIASLDLPGCVLITTGLTLLLTGLSLGGGLYSWSNVRTVVTLVLGCVGIVAFGVYEWKGTTTGILHHDMFRGGKSKGRTFILCCALVLIEGILIFAYSIFYPPLVTSLFETDPFLAVAYIQPFWVVGIFSSAVYGFVSTRFKDIRRPMFVGLTIYTGAMIGLATIQPGDSLNALMFAGMAGLGFGAPLILIVAGVQLAVPHRLIASASAVIVSARALSGTAFTAIFSAAFNDKLTTNLPRDVGRAAAAGGLPSTSIPLFVEALATNNQTALLQVPGVTPGIVRLGVAAVKQAFADSLRVVFIIAAPFGILGLVCTLFLGDLKETMNYHVDAPVEILHAKHPDQQEIPRAA